MINPEKLTVKAGEAFNEAITLARRNGNPVVYDLHLLAALLEQDESIVVPVLQKLGASVTALREQVAREIDRYPKQSDAQPTLSRELNQVFTALIENALDSMKDSGTLRLKTRLQGHMAYIEVWDSGPGIAPELRSRIFEPFFTTKAPGRGLGLGLDTAQRIVQRHSGYIHVESRPGATCFQVRIPLKPAGSF